MSTTSRRRVARRAGLALAGLVASTVALVPPAAQAAGTPSRLILTPTSTPAVSQNVSFRASEAGASKGIVEYRVAGSTAAKAVVTTNDPGYWGFAHHSATIASLSPATTYEYRVGSRLALASSYSYSGWKTFTTAKAGAGDFEFTVFGDTNEKAAADSRWAGIVTKARATAPKSVLSLHTGDQVQQTNTASHWNAWIDGLGSSAAHTNVLTTVGENEAEDPFLRSYKVKVTPPANGPKDYEDSTWYTDNQNVRFVSLDTTVSGPRLAEQATWLDAVLENNPSRWTVVSLHDGPFTAGTNPSSQPALVRTHVLPLLKKHNVDLVVSGHEGLSARGVLNEFDLGNGANKGPLFITQNSGGVDGTLAPGATNGFSGNGATALSTGQKMDTFSVVKVTTKGLSVSTRVASVRPGAAAFQGNTPVDVNTLVSGAELDSVEVLKTNDGTQKAVVEEGGTVPGFIVNDGSTPTTPNPGTSNPTPGNPGTKPGGSKPGTGQVAGLSKAKGKVSVKKMKFKAKKKVKVKVKVRSSVAGTVTVKIKVGKKTWTKKVKVKAKKWKVVSFGKKRFTAKSPRTVKVRVILKPAKNKRVVQKQVRTKWKKVRVKR